MINTILLRLARDYAHCALYFGSLIRFMPFYSYINVATSCGNLGLLIRLPITHQKSASDYGSSAL